MTQAKFPMTLDEERAKYVTRELQHEQTIESLRQQRNDLLEAVDNLSKVKGRYNTEIAWGRMADLVAKLKAAKEQGK